jgi:O-antigen ligase
VLLGVIGLELVGMYYTLTRSVWMGGALALLVVVGLTLPGAWRMPVIGTAVLAGVIGLATSWEHWVAFKRDKELSAAEMAESAKLRPILAVVAWNMFLDRPLFGCGFGQYPPESKSYLADRTTELPLEKVRKYVQHNTFLGLLTETGLVGLGLFVLVLVLWSRDAWLLWRTEQAPLWERQCGLLFMALMAVYLPNAMLHNVSLIPMVNMLLFFVAGLTSGLAARVAAPARAEARLHVYAAPPAHAAAL